MQSVLPARDLGFEDASNGAVIRFSIRRGLGPLKRLERFAGQGLQFLQGE